MIFIIHDYVTHERYSIDFAPLPIRRLCVRQYARAICKDSGGGRPGSYARQVSQAR